MKKYTPLQNGKDYLDKETDHGECDISLDINSEYSTPTKEALNVYYEGNHKRDNPLEEQEGLKRARRNGAQAARARFARPSRKKLMKKGYTEKEIKAYWEAYDKKSSATPKEEIVLEEPEGLRRARRNGIQAAKQCSFCPSENKLKRRYNPEELEAYLKGYNDTKACILSKPQDSDIFDINFSIDPNFLISRQETKFQKTHEASLRELFSQENDGEIAIDLDENSNPTEIADLFRKGI